MHIKKRVLRTVILALIGVGLGAVFALVQNKSSAPSPSTPAGPLLNVAGVGGPYTLTDHTGKVRTEADFKNTYKLIYFGFTFCPAICPTELQKITIALNELGDDASKIQPLFISVDPERDTSAVLKNYVTLFHPRLIGMTGTQDQIDAVKKAYKVYSAKVPPSKGADADEYMVDHTSFIYFMSPDDQLIALFRTEDNADVVVEQVRRTLTQP